MAFISSMSRNSSNLTTGANLGPESASCGPLSESTGAHMPSRAGRSGNHRLDAITADSSDKVKRRAVKAIAGDFAKLQEAGIRGTDSTSIAEGRSAYVEALTRTQTRLAQVTATGLSQQVPPFSFSRSTKSNLAIAGGVASEIGLIGAAGGVAAGLGVAVVVATPFTAALGITTGILCLGSCSKELIIEGPALCIAGPSYIAHAIWTSNYLQNAFHESHQFPRAREYAARPRTSTAEIAAITAQQVSTELSQFHLAASTSSVGAIPTARDVRTSFQRIGLGETAWQSETIGTSRSFSNNNQSQNWHFQENEENAVAFNAFQARLTSTAEYRNLLSKPGFVDRVNTLVDAMRASPALRDTCFTIASDSIQSCGDRVALGLNDMEQALISNNAESGKMSAVELFDTGLGFFKKQILDEIAMIKIRDLQRRGTTIDEIEIRLAYPTELRDRLVLPGVAKSMHYRDSAKVTQREIKAAEENVKQKLKQGEAVNFLAQWQPWCKAMERANPQAFATLTDVIQVARDAISTMPADMTDQQWLNALAQQKTDEEERSIGLLKQVTRKFIAQHRLAMA